MFVCAALVVLSFFGQCFGAIPVFVISDEENEPCILANLHFILTVPYITAYGRVETATVMPQSWLKNRGITASGACKSQRYTADGLSQVHNGPILALKWYWSDPVTPDSSDQDDSHLDDLLIYHTRQLNSFHDNSANVQELHESPNTLYILFEVKDNVTTLTKVEAIIYIADNKMFPDAQATDFPVKITGEFSRIHWPSSQWQSYKCNEFFISENESKYGEKIILFDMQFEIGTDLLPTFNEATLCTSSKSFKKPATSAMFADIIHPSPDPLLLHYDELFEEEMTDTSDPPSINKITNTQLLDKLENLEKPNILICEGCTINVK